MNLNGTVGLVQISFKQISYGKWLEQSLAPMAMDMNDYPIYWQQMEKHWQAHPIAMALSIHGRKT